MLYVLKSCMKKSSIPRHRKIYVFTSCISYVFPRAPTYTVVCKFFLKNGYIPIWGDAVWQKSVILYYSAPPPSITIRSRLQFRFRQGHHQAYKCIIYRHIYIYIHSKNFYMRNICQYIRNTYVLHVIRAPYVSLYAYVLYKRHIWIYLKHRRRETSHTLYMTAMSYVSFNILIHFGHLVFRNAVITKKYLEILCDVFSTNDNRYYEYNWSMSSYWYLYYRGWH